MAASTRSKAGDSSSANNGSGDDKRSNGASEGTSKHCMSSLRYLSGGRTGVPLLCVRSDQTTAYQDPAHSSCFGFHLESPYISIVPTLMYPPIPW